MAATRMVESVLRSLPLFSSDPKYPDDGSSVVDSIVEGIRRGIRMPLCIFNAGSSAMFFGKEGKLYGMGSNKKFELGVGDSDDHPEPKEVFQGTKAWTLPDAGDLTPVQIDRADKWTVVVTADLKLHVLASAQAAEPMQMLLPQVPVVQVACGASHFLALTSEGAVYSQGAGASGQLGLGHFNEAATLTQVQLMHQDRPRFATHIACGASHSMVICEQEWVVGFGSNSNLQLGITSSNGNYQNPQPAHLPEEQSMIPRPVKVACGKLHSLLLTHAGTVWGCGYGGNRQLGKLTTSNSGWGRLPIADSIGKPVDIFCHPSLNVSVLYTDKDQYYITGEAGSLFNISGCIEDFLLYDKDLISLGGAVLCSKVTAGVYIPGFNDEDCCNVQVVVKDTADAPSRIYVDSHTLHTRSPFLSDLLTNSKRLAEGVRQADGATVLELGKYSYDALFAYCRYLYADSLDCEPRVAVELLELAREYRDASGLTDQCVRLLRRRGTPGSLEGTLGACIDLGHLALGVELLKRGLCLENCCAVLAAAEAAPRDDPHAEYIREIALTFAAEHATAVVASEKYDGMPDAVKGRLLKALAARRMLKS